MRFELSLGGLEKHLAAGQRRDLGIYGFGRQVVELGGGAEAKPPCVAFVDRTHDPRYGAVVFADLELRAPTLDDVFLAKTGRTLEGATEEAETAASQRG